MKEKKNIQELQWWDVVVISVILFAFPIYNSTYAYLSTPSEILNQGTEFSSFDNWFGIGTTLLELGMGFLYLKFRNFEFSRWKFKPTMHGTIIAIGIYLVLALLVDIFTILTDGISETFAYIGSLGIIYTLSELDLSLLLFSFLNGIYEEIFFLGVCTAVPRKQTPAVLMYSLLIRFSFHTYQGLSSAIAIGFIIGGTYLWLYYRKTDKNLYPFMLSHAFADMLGASIIYML